MMDRPIRKSTRLKNHDYTSECIYYITICAEARQYLFGYKQENDIVLTPIGKIARDSWERIGFMYEGIDIDEYIVMPNHIHGIIIYTDNKHKDKVISLDKVIRNFKSYTTHEYYKNRSRTTPNLWERGYYERIIRFNELDIKREYIKKNISDWENDRFFNLRLPKKLCKPPRSDKIMATEVFSCQRKRRVCSGK